MTIPSDAALQAIYAKLSENMQIIYRKAIDADQSLAQLQQAGKGKFNHVFSDDAGFKVQSKRFMPYVEELAGQVAQLGSQSPDQFQQSLPAIIKKMESLLTTLEQFKKTL